MDEIVEYLYSVFPSTKRISLKAIEDSWVRYGYSREQIQKEMSSEFLCTEFKKEIDFEKQIDVLSERLGAQSFEFNFEQILDDCILRFRVMKPK